MTNRFHIALILAVGLSICFHSNAQVRKQNTAFEECQSQIRNNAEFKGYKLIKPRIYKRTKDKSFFYLSCNVDGKPTFQQLKNSIDIPTLIESGEFFMDTNRVYGRYTTSDGDQIIELNADRETFQAFGNTIYGRDQEFVYDSRYGRISHADVESFQAIFLDDSGRTSYGKDKNYYYFWNERIDGPELLQLLQDLKYSDSLQDQSKPKEFHILRSDTNYYELQLPENNYMLDGGPIWQRKENAPDGIFYIYDLFYTPGFGTDSRQTVDTVTYQVIPFVNGMMQGTCYEYDFNTEKLRSEWYMDNDTILSKNFYQYSDKVLIIQRQLYLDNKEYFTMTTEEDAAGIRVIATGSNNVLYRGVSHGAYVPGQFYYTYYSNGIKKSEVIITDSECIEKRWCKDGTLYFHLVQPVHWDVLPKGITYSNEDKFVVNDFIYDPVQGALPPCEE